VKTGVDLDDFSLFSQETRERPAAMPPGPDETCVRLEEREHYLQQTVGGGYSLWFAPARKALDSTWVSQGCLPLCPFFVRGFSVLRTLLAWDSPIHFVWRARGCPAAS